MDDQFAKICDHALSGLSPTATAAVALVAVHAVVHISLNVLVIRICLRFRVAVSALENRVVVRIRMTRRAHSIGVAMVDRELRVLRVIERRIEPVRGAVTVLARHREELRLRRVSRIGRAVVIRLVTSDTRRWQRLIVVVDVAIGASSRRHGVRTGQRERRVVVVERCIRPVDRVMAEFAGGREARVRHRSRRAVEIVLMARNAGRDSDVVVVVDVAIGACPWRDGMRARQRPPGL